MRSLFRVVRRRTLDARRCREARTLEARPDLGRLVRRRLDEGKPQTADLVAQQVQRGFHRYWVDRHAERVDQGLELVVDLPCAVGVALVVEPDHLLDAARDEVAVDDDAAHAADLQEGVDEVVAARVQGEVGLGGDAPRSEEHTSELQSRQYLVCRLLLEKKKQNTDTALKSETIATKKDATLP